MIIYKVFAAFLYSFLTPPLSSVILVWHCAHRLGISPCTIPRRLYLLGYRCARRAVGLPHELDWRRHSLNAEWWGACCRRQFGRLRLAQKVPGAEGYGG